MDANEYACQVTPAQKSLGVVIRSAEWIGNGKPPERQLDIETQTGSLEARQNKEPETLTPLVAKAAENEITTTEVAADVSEHEVVMNLENRVYRIRGLTKKPQL